MNTIWDKVVPAALGTVGGGVVSLLAPWLNWRIELKRQQLQQKKDTVAKWRAMLANAITESEHEGEPIQKFIERSPDFYSLRDHLSAETKDALFGRTLVVPPDRSTVDGLAGYIARDISAVEKSWKIRPE